MGDKQIKLLGEILTRKIGISSDQVKNTIKAMRAAVSTFKWLIWAKKVPLKIAEKHLKEWVEAIARAKLVVVRMSLMERSKVEEVKAEVGRLILGLPKEAPAPLVYAELEWRTTWTEVVRIKLIFLGSLWRTTQEENPILFKAIEKRSQQVKQGCKLGLMGELWEILTPFGGAKREIFWKEKGATLKKLVWKQTVNDFMKIFEELQWNRFQTEILVEGTEGFFYPKEKTQRVLNLEVSGEIRQSS